MSGSRSALPVTLRMRGCLQASLDQQPTRCVGAVGRQFPVCSAGTGERCSIGVSCNRDVLRQAHEHWRDLLKQKPRTVIGCRRTEWKHRLAVVIEDLDAQALRRHVDRELPCKVRQFRIAAHGFANLLSRLVECLLFPAFQFGTQLSLGRRPLRIAALRR